MAHDEIKKMETEIRVKFLDLDEENNTYREISFQYETTETRLWFLRFRSETLKINPLGREYNPQQLIPWGMPFEVPFYRDMPKDDRGLEAGVLEKRVLNHFFKSNPKIKESPDLILLPKQIHLYFVSGSPSGGGGGYVEDTVVAYRLRT